MRERILVRDDRRSETSDGGSGRDGRRRVSQYIDACDKVTQEGPFDLGMVHHTLDCNYHQVVARSPPWVLERVSFHTMSIAFDFINRCSRCEIDFDT